MKTEKKKSKENLIGKIIYGFLLFMPLLSVLVTCLYVIQNDNAHESYYGETINESENVYLQNNNQIIANNNDLYMENNYFVNTTLSGTLTYQNVSVVSGNFGNPTEENMAIITTSNRLYFYRGTSITFYNDETQTQFVMAGISGVILKFTNIQSTPQSNIYPAFFYIQYNKYSYLDNAFMYGLQKTEESQYFNWAKNTALYTGVNEFTNTLGITTTYIPFLMTYWLLISVVYLIYDIALMMLHMAHNKIHQLEGSV